MITKFKLTDIQLGDVKVGGIEVEAHYSLNEMHGVYDLTKTAIKELPEMVKDLRETALVVREIEEEFEDLELEDYKRNMIRNEIRKTMAKAIIRK